ncbi:hypothetical protein [Streptomyces pharetrae]|uniref:hypothetical protein n=1 Tax=Streptomyces pharetrae TaxID=291370 RepID=UPI00117C702F
MDQEQNESVHEATKQQQPQQYRRDGAPAHGLPDAWVGITLGMAAAPFLQAIASHFGDRLAGAVDEATRNAVRRFLHREAHRDRPGASDLSSVILTAENGWSVAVPVDVPVEGLRQLAALLAAAPPPVSEPQYPRVEWRETAWWLVCVDGEHGVVSYAWDMADGGWLSGPYYSSRSS